MYQPILKLDSNVISPSESSVEKAKSLSSEKQSAKAIKRRLEKSAQEKKEQLIKPLSTVKKPKRKKKTE